MSENERMKLLHSYWRMEYITAPKGDGKERNPFKHLPDKDDEEALIVDRGELTFLLLNRYPYNPGHLMALPYREVAELEDLTTEEQQALMAHIVKAKTLLQRALKPNGFNIGFNFGKAAGEGIPEHLHAHIVPRWDGDNNFLPVIGETRTLPQALAETWKVLRASL